MVRLRGREPAEIARLAEALVWVVVGSIAVAVVPFRLSLRVLGLSVGEQRAPLDQRGQRRAADVGVAVRAIARRTPWRTACLTQAWAATAMLRTRHLPVTLYLGVQNPGSDVGAHAWVRSGTEIVTGASEQAAFTPVGAFCSS